MAAIYVVPGINDIRINYCEYYANKNAPRYIRERKKFKTFFQTGKRNIMMRNFLSRSKASATLYLLRGCFFQRQRFGLGSAIFDAQLKFRIQTNLIVV